MFENTIVSSDGKALCIFVPIEAKNMSYRISQQVQGILTKHSGSEEYYITGLPVAEDTFGGLYEGHQRLVYPLRGA